MHPHSQLQLLEKIPLCQRELESFAGENPRGVASVASVISFPLGEAACMVSHATRRTPQPPSVSTSAHTIQIALLQKELLTLNVLDGNSSNLYQQQHQKHVKRISIVRRYCGSKSNGHNGALLQISGIALHLCWRCYLIF